MTSRQPAIAPAIRKLFADRGAQPIEVAVLQPADPFLDIAGEDLRRRIFLTESEGGKALCLRPEFTIPVCLDHIASRAGAPRRYFYLGEVFRQRRDGGSEFLQAGIEDIGEPDIAEADARSLADAMALFDAVLPGRELAVTLGDQAVFEAVLAALGLPRGWQKRLARAFGAPEMLQSALADLTRPTNGPMRDAVYPHLSAVGDHASLTEGVRAAMETAGFPAAGGRTPDEIARRLLEKAELSRVRLPGSAFAALKTFLDIRAPLDRAVDTLTDFARDAGLQLGGALELFAARAAAMARHGMPVEKIRYDAAFGRPLDYYTGLVFEIAAPGGQRPLVGGGRYDRLLTLLGAPQPIPGVGFSVWLDRIEQLREGGA
jgi:ATP phosphoribosyltransferase regulatory subunit